MIKTTRNRNTLRMTRAGACLVWSCGALLSLGTACTDHADSSLAPDESATDPGDPSNPDPTSNIDPSQTDTTKSTDPKSTDPSNPNNPDPPGVTDPNNPDAPGGWGTTPALRNTVTLSDADLASQALGLLSNTCSSCHTLDRTQLTHWAQLTKDFATGCLANTALPDQGSVDAMLACFQQRANAGAKQPSQFGIYAAAARLPWFSFLFQHSAGGASAQSSFVSSAGMPLAGTPLTQAEFDVVAEWYARKLPRLFDLVPEDQGETCSAGLDTSLNNYLDQIAVTGWRAKNAQVPLLMYGCQQGQSGSLCLSTLPRAAAEAFSAGWESAPGTQIRILYDNSATLSNYWSRCSPDGRYIGSGLSQPRNGHSGQIIDLQGPTLIEGAFAYDATFFPDNSGFLMQREVNDDGPLGAPTDGSVAPNAQALVCEQSVLSDASVVSAIPPAVTGEEPKCGVVDGKFGLYQQTSKSVDGSDYWVVHGSYEGDSGGFTEVLEEPYAAFGPHSTTTLTPLVNQGNGDFVAGAGVHIETPHMGDPMLSPSGGLMVMRVKGPDYSTMIEGSPVTTSSQSGYAIYAVDKSTSGGSSAALHDLGRICLQGGKATFSYDERFLVLHHYVLPSDATDLGFTGPSDSAFQASYGAKGASNLVLVDLRTGTATRITNMHAGQYALFPHFRSDGWIYFVVRTTDGEEYYAASDAALVAEAH